MALKLVKLDIPCILYHIVFYSTKTYNWSIWNFLGGLSLQEGAGFMGDGHDVIPECGAVSLAREQS